MHEVGGVGLLRIEREVGYGVWMSLAWLCDAAERLAYLGCVTLSNGDCWVGGNATLERMWGFGSWSKEGVLFDAGEVEQAVSYGSVTL